MSVQAMGWVIEHSKAGGGDLLVLLMIANHAKSDGTGAWPSVSRLAKECRMSERNVQYCLRDLERSGELLIETGAGPKRTNLYTVKPVAGANLAGAQSATVEGAKVAPSPVKPVAPEPSLEPSKKQPSLEHHVLSDLLADLIEENGSPRPTISRSWLDAERLLLEKDRRGEEEAARVLRWAQSSPFWRSNILSMPKFREKYDQLRLQMDRPNGHDRAAELMAPYLAERGGP